MLNFHLNAFVALTCVTALVACGGGGDSASRPAPAVVLSFDPNASVQLESPAVLPSLVQLSVLPNGDALTVFRVTSASGKQQLVSRRIFASGQLSEPDILSEVDAGGNYDSLQLKIAPGGAKAYAVFGRNDSSGVQSIAALEYITNGSATGWSAERVVAGAPSLVDRSPPDLAFDPFTQAPCIVWKEIVGGIPQIKASTLRQLTGWSNTELVTTEFKALQYDFGRPRIAFLKDGTRVAVMEAHDLNTANKDVMAVVVSARGSSTWGGTSLLLPLADGRIKSSDLARSPNGGLAVVWEHAVAATGKRSIILASQLGADGKWSQAKLIDTGAVAPSSDDPFVGQNSTEPHVTLDSNERAIVLWKQQDPANVVRLYGAALDLADPPPAHAAVRLDGFDSSVGAASALVLDTSGQGTVTWTQSGAQGAVDLYAARWDTVKGEVAAPQLVEARAEAVDQGSLSLAVSPKGRAYVAWVQNGLNVNNNKGPVN